MATSTAAILKTSNCYIFKTTLKKKKSNCYALAYMIKEILFVFWCVFPINNFIQCQNIVTEQHRSCQEYHDVLADLAMA